MIFLFPRWDMLVPWRVWLYHQLLDVWWSMWAKNKTPYQTYTLRQTNTAGWQIRILFLVNTIKMLVFFHGYLTYRQTRRSPKKIRELLTITFLTIETPSLFSRLSNRKTSWRAPIKGLFNQDDAPVLRGWGILRDLNFKKKT